MNYRIIQQKRDITIRIQQNHKMRRETIEAQTLLIEGFEQFVLAVHRDIMKPNDWTVTELNTGLVVAKAETRANACASITARINRMGAERFEETIKCNIDKIAMRENV